MAPPPPAGRRAVLHGLASLPLAAVSPLSPPPSIMPAADAVFAVRLQEDPIGEHRVRLTPDDGGLVVETALEAEATLGFIPIFSYVATGFERWRGGRLIEMLASTRDGSRGDGTTEVRAWAEGDRLMVDGPAGRFAAPPGVLPGSFWHPETIRSDLLGTTTGAVRRPTVTPLGVAAVPAGPSSVAARGFRLSSDRLSGDPSYDLWYANGLWVAFGMTMPEGGRIDFRLTSPLKRLAPLAALAAAHA